MPYLSSRPLGTLGPWKSLPPCLGLEADCEGCEANSPEQLLMAKDAGSDGMEGPGPLLVPSPHPGVQ